MVFEVTTATELRSDDRLPHGWAAIWSITGSFWSCRPATFRGRMTGQTSQEFEAFREHLVVWRLVQ